MQHASPRAAPDARVTPELPWRLRVPSGHHAPMHEKFTALTPELYRYIIAHTPPPDEVLRDLAAETAALGGIAAMQIAVEQGAFLTQLARLLGARRIVEVGTFTGYSAICLARGLAPGGTLLCCDLSAEWTAIARRYWTRAGLDDRITLRLGPAGDTLRALPETPDVDLAFVDADKPGYRDYYELLLPRLRPNGLIVFDNVLWGGAVADPARDDRDTAALRALNGVLATDPRVDAVMLPVADGLFLVRKR
jgi:caffeoyl-CoA O-methyltransferase